MRALLPLVMLCILACKKLDQTQPTVRDDRILILANVPHTITSTYKRIYLDASRTLNVNRNRALSFAWSLRDYPTGVPRPQILNSNSMIASVDSLFAPGQYQFRLLVKDGNANVSDTVFTIDVIRDSLLDYPTRAHAGIDQSIMAPQDEIDLNGMETYRLNPTGRNLNLLWSVVSQPPGSPIVWITNAQVPITSAGNLRTGSYQFRLEVENELGVRASDTVTVQVMPDALKGTTLIFEQQPWEKFIEPDNGWGEWVYVAIRIRDDRFLGRGGEDFVVRVWNEAKSDWDLPATYAYDVDKSQGILVVYYPWHENESIYFSALGKKTRLQVTFL